jgi:hypothetical protein
MTPRSLGLRRRSKDFAAHWRHPSLIRGVGNTASDFLEKKREEESEGTSSNFE